MAVQTEHSLRLGVEIKKKLKEFDLDVSFDAGKGCLGILGPSGCGKSMTLKSIAGIVTPDSGRIALQYAKGEAAGGRGCAERHPDNSRDADCRKRPPRQSLEITGGNLCFDVDSAVPGS